MSTPDPARSATPIRPSHGPAPLDLAVVSLPALGRAPDRETARGAMARAALQETLETWSGPLDFAGAAVGVDTAPVVEPDTASDTASDTGPDRGAEATAVLVVAPGPAEQVAAALQDGMEMEAALAAWQEMSAALTAFLDRRRNTVLLAWDAAVLHDPAAVLGQVAVRLGLEVAAPAPPAGPAPQEPPPLRARFLLQAELGLAGLTTPPALDRHWLDLPDHVDGLLRARLDSSALLRRVTEEERTAGQAEMHALLRETEDAWLERETRRIEAQAAERAEERAAHATETDRHLAEILRLSQEAEYYRRLSETVDAVEKTALEDAQTKIGSLRDTLGKTRKTLEDAHTDARKARSEKDTLEKKAWANINQLAERLETAQANARKARADKARLEKTARANIDQLAERLEATQARLDDQVRRTRERAAEAERLNRMVEAGTARRKAAEDRAEQLDQRIDTLHSELDAARAELEAMRQSTSWRLTRPLRNIRLMFRRRPETPSQETPSQDALPPDRSGAAG